MNVQQLGTGTTDIGFFFLNAVLVGVFVVILATIVKPVEQAIQDARRRVALAHDLDIDWVQRRDILRFSSIGEKINNAMTVVDEDGNAIHDVFGFRAVLMSWFGFHSRRVWQILIGKIRGKA